MNPQPHPFVGQLGVLIFALLVTYFAFTNKNKKTFNISDTFNLGYIYDTPIEVVEYQKPKRTSTPKPRRTTVKQKPKSQPVPQPKKSEKPQIDQELFDDCVLALVSLGSKKSEAKTTAKNIFEKHNPQTIEDFIKFVYVK